MTAFMLLDEFERDFEPLESDPARHAAAIATYCLVGQAVAQRTLDGRIPKVVLQKRLASWPRKMVSAAIADLISIGKWESDPDTGELRFLDWDLSQFSRDQELARRSKAAKRQREKRARDRVRGAHTVTRDVTRDVANDVTGVVTVPTTSPQPNQSQRERSTWKAEGSASSDPEPGWMGPAYTQTGGDCLDELEPRPLLKAVRS